MRAWICTALWLAACTGVPSGTDASHDPATTQRYERPMAGPIGARRGAATCLAALSPDDTAAQPPARLSQTGCFSDLAKFQPAAHVAVYAVNSQLYSDGAEKLRFMALPTTATLDMNQSMELWHPQA